MLASDRSRVYIRSRTRKVIGNDYEGLDCGANALCSWQYKAIGGFQREKLFHSF